MKKITQRKTLPVDASLDHLRKQAKRKVKHNPTLKLAAAQHEVAREYGFRNWAEMGREVKAMAGGAGPKAELNAAILSGDLAGATGLLERWPKMLDVDLWPVAMYQAASPAMTRLLLERGLDPNRSSSPRKPLHFAVAQGWPDIVNELLGRGADPNIRDGEDFTPLDLYGGLAGGTPQAAGQIQGILRQAGAEVSVWTAIRIGDTELALALLVENPDLINAHSPDLGFLPLHVAARMANDTVVRWLLDHGADVNALNPAGNTALWFVCQSGAAEVARLEAAQMLISAGADINRRCENGSTALSFAAWRGPAEMVELLLRHGARNWVVDNEGKLPVDYASGSNVSRDKEAILALFRGPRIQSEVFREAVAAITVGDGQKLRGILKEHTGLVRERAEEDGGYAGSYFYRPYLLEFVPENPVRSGALPPNICEIAKVIIDAGAPPEAVTKTLVLAASGSVARECGVQTELIELLVANGGDSTAGLDGAIGEGEWSAAKTLVRLGARIGLKAAAGLGELKALKKLMSASPGLEAKAEAANAAIRGGHIECVRLLLDARLPADSLIPQHPNSPTLLHQAAWFGQLPIAELLLARGADAGAKDSQYDGTPANWAHHAGHAELSEWLREKERPGPH